MNPAVPNTRRRIVTKTRLEENTSDERTVAVTTEESLDGIREKVMRKASLDEMGASSSARGDIVVACDSKSKLSTYFLFQFH